MPNPSEKKIKDRMEIARIPGVTIASVDGKGTVNPRALGRTDIAYSSTPLPINSETIFGAASLSKPVFSYLVLKLIDTNKLPAVEGKLFDLDTPLSKILPLETFYKDVFNVELSKSDAKKANVITARMVLSHTTGIPISGAPKFDFEPGTEFSYSGMPFIYLQKIIEKQTGKSLESLAQEEVFKPLNMEHSSFMPPTRPHSMAHTESSRAKVRVRPNAPLTPPVSANSLHTTASDYALLVSAWMNDPSNTMQAAFKPHVSLMKDKWAEVMGVSEGDRKHLAWGLGFGLELDDAKKPIKAFHTGDMNQWRGWVAMDLKTKSAVVYFANGRHHKDANGHVLADVIISPEVTLNHAPNWFFQKFVFARNVEPGWQDREKANMIHIGKYLSKTTHGATVDADSDSTARMLRTMPSHISTKPEPVTKATDEIKSEPVSSESDDANAASHKSPTPFSRTPKPRGA